MARLEINWVEAKIDKKGGEYKRVTIGGQSMNCWPRSFSPQFYAELRPGGIVDGFITKGKTGYDELRENKDGDGPASIKVNAPASTPDFQKRKEDSIEMAQMNKEYSIRTASTMSAAVEIVRTLIEKGLDDPEKSVQEMILGWRKWLWDNWDYKDMSAPPQRP